MMKKPEITEKELSDFLKGLGIKETGIQAILKTYPMGIQRARFKTLVKNVMERNEEAPKEAVWRVWKWFHKPQVVHFRPVGSEPTESDFFLL